jgi:hypothetical protein
MEKIDGYIYEYIGDGVYAKFDGFGVWLLANDHLNPTDKVYLEPEVLNALNRFVKQLNKED